MSEKIDSLSIEIQASAAQATKAIDKLKDSLGGLRDKKPTETKAALDSVSEKSSEAAKRVGLLSKQMSGLKKGAKNLVKAWGLDKVGAAARGAGQGVKGLLRPFASLTRAMGRIALYRAMRTAIREIAQAAKEGSQNLYQWSLAVGGASYSGRKFSEIMDGVASSTQYLKNAFGTALSNAIAALAPVLDSLSEKIVNLINHLNNLFAVLRGDSTYNRAVKTTTQFATAAGKAAKELKNLVFGFDELNIIPAQQGGGGAAAPDYSGMFEETEVDLTDPLIEKFNKIRETIDNISKSVLNLKGIAASLKIDWKSFKQGFGFNGQTVAKTVILGLEALMGGVTGFMLAGPLGAVVGTVLGVRLGLAIDRAIFDADGKISGRELKDTLLIALGGISGGIVGRTLFGPGVGTWLGAFVGTSIALGIVDGTFDQTLSKLKLSMFENSLKTVLGAATLGLIGWKLAGTNGALLGMTVGSLLTIFTKEGKDGIFQNGGLNKENALEAILKILAATTIGFIVWSSSGELLAATLAFNLTLSILELDWSGIGKAIKDAFERAKQEFTFQYDNFLRWVKGEETRQRVINVDTGKITYSDGTIDWEISRKKKSTPFSAEGIGGGSFASGGTPQLGSLFVAGEAGPEFVGQVGGQTQVYNEDQLAQTLSVANEGLMNVIIQAANALISAVDDKELSVNIGDREIAASAARGARLNGRAMVQ